MLLRRWCHRAVFIGRIHPAPGERRDAIPTVPSVLTQHQPGPPLGTSFPSFVRLSLVREEWGSSEQGLSSLSRPAASLSPAALLITQLRLARSRLSSPASQPLEGPLCAEGSIPRVRRVERTSHRHPCPAPEVTGRLC